ncbi:MAG TPA: triose-phosphate isomerase, partial [Firmicutes bacterium]|nr:triose-phosphate isomerase [Bacillota bacterium]
GFAGHPQIDGALVGGASLDPVSFATIIEAFAHMEPGSAGR